MGGGHRSCRSVGQSGARLMRPYFTVNPLSAGGALFALRASHGIRYHSRLSSRGGRRQLRRSHPRWVRYRAGDRFRPLIRKSAMVSIGRRPVASPPDAVLEPAYHRLRAGQHPAYLCRRHPRSSNEQRPHRMLGSESNGIVGRTLKTCPASSGVLFSGVTLRSFTNVMLLE
jgi:hypothetical protein